MKFSNRISSSQAGFTLVEIVVVLIISSIVMVGMLTVYTDGIRYWKSSTEKIVLYNEGSLALAKMAKWIRNANFIRIRSFSGLPDAKLDLRYNNPAWGAEFFFVEGAGELRWNDQTEGRNIFNKRLLPVVRFRGNGPNEEPYLTVASARFTALDDIGTPSPTLLGYSLIKIDLVLVSQDYDTLNLSSVVSKRNK